MNLLKSEPNVTSTKTSIAIESTCSCCLSFVGSFIIFGTYIFIPEIRNATRKLVTCLTVADLMTSFGIFMSSCAYLSGTFEDVCTTQSVITTYSNLVSFNLTSYIAIHIFVTVLSRNDKTSSRKFLLLANITSWVIPGIIVAVAGANGALGRTNDEFDVGPSPWCWVKKDKNFTFWVFMTGKGWEFLCYLITTSLYILLKLYLFLKSKYKHFAEIHPSLRNNDKNYLYVWFILYILRLWGSIRSMMAVAHANTEDPGKTAYDVLRHFQAIGDPAQAFCNCILVCFLDKQVRSHLYRICLVRHREITPEERDRIIGDNHRDDSTAC